MASFHKVLSFVLLTSAVWTVNGESTFAGSSVSSGPGGSRSVLVTGRNGAAGGGVIQSRFGGGSAGVSTGSGSGPVGTFASAGGASAYAGPGGAYAGPGGAYAGAGGAPWGFPYWNNGGGSYASAGAGAPYNYDYPQPYPYDPYPYGGGTYGGGSTGVYSGSDSNGIQTRFAKVDKLPSSNKMEMNLPGYTLIRGLHKTLKKLNLNCVVY